MGERHKNCVDQMLRCRDIKNKIMQLCILLWHPLSWFLPTLALASLAASASAAMALCSWTGSLTSLLKHATLYSSPGLVKHFWKQGVNWFGTKVSPDILYGLLFGWILSSENWFNHWFGSKITFKESYSMIRDHLTHNKRRTNSHFYSLRLDTPWVCSLIQIILHHPGYWLSLWQDLWQVPETSNTQ